MRALNILQRVVDDSAALLGENHPDTLHARISLARQLGASGNPEQALDIARDVNTRATKQNMILNARFEAALWAGALMGQPPQPGSSGNCFNMRIAGIGLQVLHPRLRVEPRWRVARRR